MGIDRWDFNAISEDDLNELVTAQVPEGIRLEYKSQSYGRSDADKREFLKDISAFANAQGGHLVLGVEEATGAAVAAIGLSAIDPDAELLRLEQLARSGLEPRIIGMRMKAVPLSNGNSAILLRVPPSWNRPHRVIAQASNRFHVRHSAGVHEPNVEELRLLFIESTSALDKARHFRAQRLEKVASASDERPLVGGGRLIMHIIPVPSFAGASFIDMEKVYAKGAAFPPLGTSSRTPRFNYFGFINDFPIQLTQVVQLGADCAAF